MEARRGRPTNAFRKALKAPKRADYEKLVRGAVQALLGGSESVLVAFPYVFKFPKDFPKGILVEKTLTTNVRKLKAAKLLKWLGDKGHTDITMETLRVAQIRFTMNFDKEI